MLVVPRTEVRRTAADASGAFKIGFNNQPESGTVHTIGEL